MAETPPTENQFNAAGGKWNYMRALVVVGVLVALALVVYLIDPRGGSLERTVDWVAIQKVAVGARRYAQERNQGMLPLQLKTIENDFVELPLEGSRGAVYDLTDHFIYDREGIKREGDVKLVLLNAMSLTQHGANGRYGVWFDANNELRIVWFAEPEVESLLKNRFKVTAPQ